MIVLANVSKSVNSLLLRKKRLQLLKNPFKKTFRSRPRTTSNKKTILNKELQEAKTDH